MKEKKRKIINILLLLIFLVFGFMVRNSAEGIIFDVRLLKFLHKATNPTLLKIMKGISYIGAEKFLIPLMLFIIVFNLIKKNIAESIFLLVNTLGSFTLNSIIKQFFHRTRPFDFSIVKQGGLSYPSGHAMVVMSMYLAIYYLLTRKEMNKNKRIFIGIVIGIYIISMGISRMYLGVHWPTDIIGGYICGYLLYNTSKRIIKG